MVRRAASQGRSWKSGKNLSSGVKTTLQSNVQLDEMRAAEPYKSVSEVTTEQRWLTLFGCCPNPTDSANGLRLEEHDCN
jgi:hypothetical protein